MVTKNIKYFSLRKIMESGQIFRMYEPEEGHFIVYSGERRLELNQEGEKVEFLCSEDEYSGYWEEYFDLKRDYGEIVRKAEAENSEKTSRGSEFLMHACEYGADIRVLKQDVWEMMISFIISQQKQIPSIRKCIEALCERFGEKRGWNCFPTADAIASGGSDGLKGLSLGYRERYIYETAVKFVADEMNSEKIRKMPASEVKKYLCSFTGIGEKVADCVCLFGVGLADSFPIDVHIKDILYREFIPKERQNEIEKTLISKSSIEEVGRKKLLDSISYQDYMKIVDEEFSGFKGVRGIVQQWIFAYEINAKQQ